MFSIVLSKEIREHMMTFRFGAALVTTFVLVMISMWVLGEDYVRRRDAFNVAAETSARHDREEVFVPSAICPTLYRPPSALSIFCQGEDRRFGNSVMVSRWEVPREATGNFGRNMMMAAQPAFDLFTVVAVVLSLLGLVFTYDGISGEREKGILKLLLSCGGSRQTIYTAKFLGGVICLAIPFLVGMAVGLILLTFLINVGFTPSEWVAITALTGAALIFGALFIALGLACSALVRRSSVALVLSLFLWTALVVILPSTAQSIADTIVPLPPPSGISNIEKRTWEEALDRERELSRRYPQAGYGFWTGTSIGNGGRFFIYDTWPEAYRDTENLIRELEPFMQARADKVWSAYNEQEKAKIKQADFEKTLVFIAPVHHLRGIFQSLTGTGFSIYDNFMEATRRYRVAMINEFRDKGYFSDNVLKFFSRRDPVDIDDEKFRQRYQYYQDQLQQGKRYDEFMGPKFWGPLPASETPNFTNTVEPVDFESALWPTGFLLVAVALLFVIGFAAFLRYDVR